MKWLLLLSLLLVNGSHAMDYVQCEAIQRAAARLKAAMDNEASPRWQWLRRSSGSLLLGQRLRPTFF